MGKTKQKKKVVVVVVVSSSSSSSFTHFAERVDIYVCARVRVTSTNLNERERDIFKEIYNQ